MRDPRVQKMIILAQHKVVFAELCCGEESVKLIKELVVLGNLYAAVGKHSSAKQVFWRVLNIQYKAYGAMHCSNAAALIELGELYQLDRELHLAQQFYEESLWILDQDSQNCAQQEEIPGLCLDSQSKVEMMREVLHKLHGIYSTNGDIDRTNILQNRLNLLADNKNRTQLYSVHDLAGVA